MRAHFVTDGAALPRRPDFPRAAEQRQAVAHGVSRGKSASRSKPQPGRNSRQGQAQRCCTGLCRPASLAGPDLSAFRTPTSAMILAVPMVAVRQHQITKRTQIFWSGKILYDTYRKTFAINYFAKRIWVRLGSCPGLHPLVKRLPGGNETAGAGYREGWLRALPARAGAGGADRRCASCRHPEAAPANLRCRGTSWPGFPVRSGPCRPWRGHRTLRRWE